jgi:hypothetical protein
MLKSKSSSNIPEFITPNFEKSEKTFAKYCYLYDPLVLRDSAMMFENPNETPNTWSTWHWEGFTRFIGKSNLIYYYSCVAPYIEKITSNRAIELVENYQKEISSRTDSNKRFCVESLLETLSKNLDQFFFVKQYIFYKCKDKEGWLIVLRTKDTKNEFVNPIKGRGETLEEASIDFAKNQSAQFTKNNSYINILLDNEIPLTTKDMFLYCSKFDPEVDPLSSRFIRPRQYSNSTIPYNYSLKCESSKTAFFLDIDYKNVKWRIKKLLKLENESPIIGCTLPVETSHFTIEEAFRNCEAKIEHLQNNPEDLRQAVADLERETMAKDLEYDRLEGEAFIDSMISEYGEDIFPDR